MPHKKTQYYPRVEKNIIQSTGQLYFLCYSMKNNKIIESEACFFHFLSQSIITSFVQPTIMYDYVLLKKLSQP